MVKDHLLLTRKPSLSLGVLLGCCHVMAIAGIFEVNLPVSNELVFTYSVLVSFVYNLNRHCLLRDPLTVIAVSFDNGFWLLTLHSGERVAVELELPVFVNRYLVVMNFKDTRRRKFPVAVFGDGADVTQMRHMRVFLKLGMAQPNVGGTNMVSFGASNNNG